MREGFDVHHMDGNPENNAPENLVLIECQDHMRLHGSKSGALRRLYRNGKVWGEAMEPDHITGEKVYNLRLWEISWKAICKAMNASQPTLANKAKAFAKANSLKWPMGIMTDWRAERTGKS